MPKTTVYTTSGKAKGEINLPEEVFGVKVNPQLMAQAVRVYLANQRGGNADTMTRAEINRTKAKWFRQKGTGRARHGSRSAPIFVGGGLAHGPKSRDWSLSFPDKMRRAAFASALSQMNAEKKIVILEKIQQIEPKTREAVKILNNLNLISERVTWVIGERTDNLIKATRNMTNVVLENAKQINTYQVLDSDKIIVSEDAIEILKNRVIANIQASKTPKTKPADDAKKTVRVARVKKTAEKTNTKGVSK